MKHLFLLCLTLVTFVAQAQIPENAEKSLRKLNMAQIAIGNLYVDTVNFEKLTEDAIEGMLKSLDPHSSYTNAQDTKRMNEPLQGNFEGIGIQFNMIEDTLVVIQTIKGGPSESAGIRAGDRIVSVNDTAIASVKMSRELIMSKLRGAKGTKVKVGVVRRGLNKMLYFTLKRDKIPVVSLDAAYMITPNTGLIRFDNFGATTHEEFLTALKKLQSKGMKHLILDLQSNGGGYLGAAVEVANEFLKQNDLIVYTQGRSQPLLEYKARGGGRFQEGKLVILVDEFSASAAEIVAGAVQDHDRGYIVGRRTFGKGLVQRPIDLPDGSMIRLTVAHYYTPVGRDIQKPYVKGKRDDYEKDLLDRYEHGEFFHADSVHFSDSLKFTTLGKRRTVYGGGGIMPDYFVPVDTTRFTPYYRAITRTTAINDHILRYTDKERKALLKKYSDFAAYKAAYAVPQSLIDDILATVKKDSIVAKNADEYDKTVFRLRQLLKSLIARNLWDTTEFYELAYEDDPIVLKALDLLRQED